MTRRLILMRHAKSSWGTPDLEDHARPLNARGRASAEAVGTWLQARGYVPDQVLSSDAQRTRETWAQMTGSFKAEIPVAWQPSLYLAGPGALFKAMQAASGASVMMLGHNPGIASFAQVLLSIPPKHPRFFDYPTGATLVVEFPVDNWRDVAAGSGQDVDFIVPRQLLEGDGAL